MDGLEEAGLAGCVFAENQIDARGRLDLRLLNDTEIPYAQTFKPHALQPHGHDDIAGRSIPGRADYRARPSVFEHDFNKIAFDCTQGVE